MYNFEGVFDESILTTKFIESRITHEDIYKRYLGYTIHPKSKLKSPFTNDSNPSFKFFVKSNTLLWKDFSSGKGGDCYKLVADMYALGFKDSILKIVQDFNLIACKNPIPDQVKKIYREKKPCKIQLELQDFMDEDLQYWGQFGISLKALNYYDVKSVKQVWLNDNLFKTYRYGNPIYRYVNNGYKIYSPFDISWKWITNIGKSAIWGLDQLDYSKDLVIITSSVKDILANYEMGYNSVCLNSETIDVPEKLVKYLQSKFKHIVLFLDNDPPGIKAAKKAHKKYDIKYLYIPQFFNSKDVSDCIRDYGKDFTNELIENLLTIYILK